MDGLFIAFMCRLLYFVHNLFFNVIIKFFIIKVVTKPILTTVFIITKPFANGYKTTRKKNLIDESMKFLAIALSKMSS